MENKKSIILYCDLIHTVNQLPNDKAGLLFKHILSYVNDENPETDDIIVKIAFEPIKQQLKRDLVKWEGRAERSRENGKLGGRPKNPTEPSGLNENPDEPKEPVSGNVTVNAIVSGNVNDAVNDNDNANVTDKENNKELVYEKIVHDCYYNCLEFFTENLRPKKDSIKNLWLKTIKDLIDIDKIPPEKIIDLVKKTRADDFWRKHFSSLAKLRRTNQEGTSYIVVFDEQNKGNGKQKGNLDWLAEFDRSL